MILNQDIIVLSGIFYDDLFTSKQQISRIFARTNRVLFVEPYLTLLTPFSQPELKPHFRRSIGKRVLRQKDHLWIYTPRPMLPFRHRSGFIQSINDYFYARLVKKTAQSLGFTNPILYSFVYDTAAVVGKLGEKLSVYHCADDWAEMPFRGKNKERVRKLEAELARRVHLVLSASERNTQRLARFNANSFHVPNGVDFDLFNHALDTQSIPEDLKEIPQPRVGFIGTMDSWVDNNLIEYVARRQPEWSLILIGPTKVNVDSLKKYPNVYIIGRKPREFLPAYLHFIQVCIIPFLVNDLTAAVNPLKLFEYLAAGKPVISTDMPEVRAAQPHAYVASSYEDFLRLTAEAIEKTDHHVENRVAYARASSWECRVQAISTYLEIAHGRGSSDSLPDSTITAS